MEESIKKRAAVFSRDKNSFTEKATGKASAEKWGKQKDSGSHHPRDGDRTFSAGSGKRDREDVFAQRGGRSERCGQETAQAGQKTGRYEWETTAGSCKAVSDCQKAGQKRQNREGTGQRTGQAEVKSFRGERYRQAEKKKRYRGRSGQKSGPADTSDMASRKGDIGGGRNRGGRLCCRGL